MKLATWNVNSLSVRLPQLLDWLAAATPDIVVLQETKLTDDKFPADALQAAGYDCAWFGQKTYNGVALLARSGLSITEVTRNIPGLDDPQARVIAATVGGLRIVGAYFPNGQAPDSEKFVYKRAWLAALQRWLAQELDAHPALALMGDFNIAPDDRDVHDPVAWHEQILCSTPERDALRRLLDLGLVDSFRLFDAEAGHFSWWDYRQAAYRRNLGLRIDLVLAGAPLAARASACGIDRGPRRNERPSDHAPVWVTLR